MLTLEQDGQGIAILRFDNDLERPNLLDEAAIAALEQHLDRLIGDATLKGVIVTGGEKSGFLAGVDIHAIAGAVGNKERILELCDFAQRVFDRLRVIPVPTIAAINGTCLGGGMELALCCKYRVMADDRNVRIGLPEVNIGIIPGFSGSQRLPRLVGLARAIEVAASGRRLMPRQAHKLGVVDEVVPPALLMDVARYTIARWDTPAMKAYLRDRLLPKGLRAKVMESFPGRVLVSALARRSIMKATGGNYPAPLRLVRVMHNGLIGSLQAGLKLEREAIADLLGSEPPLSPARHLLDIFRLRESHRRDYPGRLERVAAGSRKYTLPAQAGVVGAGFMGGAIAQLLATNHVDVRMKDVAPASIGTAMRTLHDLTRPLVKKRRLMKHEAMALTDRVMPSLDYSGFERCGIVLEAVVERLDVKRTVMRELEQVVGKTTIIATNTSSLPIAQIADGLEHPGRVIGLHFFSPVHQMPLVEIIAGPKTSPETIEQAFRFATKLDKVPVICKDSPGFLVNRVLGAYLNEAGWCLYDGAAPGWLDAALREFGMPVGPCELIDEVGLKVAGEVANVLREAWPEYFPNAGVVDAMIGKGHLGKRATSSGLYRYGKSWLRGRRVKRPSADLRAVLKDLRARVGEPGGPPAPRPVGRAEVVERCLTAMIVEAWRALKDGVVRTPDDVDTAMVFGTGFPPFRGGLMRYAESLGREALQQRLKRLSDECGPRFTPCDPPPPPA
ncbi:MAG: 3-hydroxyacyl-CoA dehydrogenase NAD-binding domain-containing protein [Planctomycetota bacterium]